MWVWWLTVFCGVTVCGFSWEMSCSLCLQQLSKNSKRRKLYGLSSSVVLQLFQDEASKLGIGEMVPPRPATSTGGPLVEVVGMLKGSETVLKVWKMSLSHIPLHESGNVCLHHLYQLTNLQVHLMKHQCTWLDERGLNLSVEYFSQLSLSHLQLLL